MAGIATTMSWILQVVDRGASARLASFSNQMGGIAGRSATTRSALASARGEIRGYALQTGVAAAMTFGLGTAMQRSVAKFGAFEEKLTATKLVLRASSAEMARFRRQALELPGKLEFTPAGLAEVQRTLGQAGFSALEVRKSLGNVADLATAGMLDLGEATELNITLQRGFRTSLAESALAQDKLVRLTQLTPLSIDETRKALGFATGSAAAFNQTLDDTLITLGLLKPITQTASKAGTSLRSALRAVTRPRGRTIMEQIGVTSIDAAGQTRPLLDILLDIELAIGRQDKTQRQFLLSQLLGIRGMQAYTAVTAAGADEIRRLRSGVANAQGTTARFASGMRNTYAASMGRFDASTEALQITLGETFGKDLAVLARGAADFVQGLTKFMGMMEGWPARIIAYGAAWKFTALAMRTARLGASAFATSAAAGFLGIGGPATAGAQATRGASGGGGAAGGLRGGQSVFMPSKQASVPLIISPLTGMPVSAKIAVAHQERLAAMGLSGTAREFGADLRRAGAAAGVRVPQAGQSQGPVPIRPSTPIPRVPTGRVLGSDFLGNLAAGRPGVGMPESVSGAAMLRRKRLIDVEVRRRVAKAGGDPFAVPIDANARDAALKRARFRAERATKGKGPQAFDRAFTRFRREAFESRIREEVVSDLDGRGAFRRFDDLAQERTRGLRTRKAFDSDLRRAGVGLRSFSASAMKTSTRFVSGIGDTLGLLGTFAVMIESLGFAVSRVNETMLELNSAQRIRLEQLDERRGALPKITELTKALVDAPRTPAGMLSLQPDLLRRLLPDLEAVGVGPTEIQRLASLAEGGATQIDLLRDIVKATKLERGVVDEESQRKLDGIIKAVERDIRRLQIEKALDRGKTFDVGVLTDILGTGQTAQIRREAQLRLSGVDPSDAAAATLRMFQDISEATRADPFAKAAGLQQLFSDLKAGELGDAALDAVALGIKTGFGTGQLSQAVSGLADFIAQGMQRMVIADFGPEARAALAGVGGRQSVNVRVVDGKRTVDASDLGSATRQISAEQGRLGIDGAPEFTLR